MGVSMFFCIDKVSFNYAKNKLPVTSERARSTLQKPSKIRKRSTCHCCTSLAYLFSSKICILLLLAYQSLKNAHFFQLRPLHHHFSASPSTKRSQSQNPENLSNSVFYPANTEKLKLRNSNWDSARPVLSSRPPLYVQDHKFAEVLKSPIKYTPTNNTMRLFKDSEPMEIELGFDDFGSKYYYNDSMEIDIDDDNMEVDTTVDIESLMDFIPMN
ncbi:hypothetical protein CAEBREN_10332 [Caenorhabditis brenneri]|uniref:Uncharacterized protein n=1 Tax=Caenorhabditis brenneri TaxID=135651 RepID=G0MVP9_CAEBE|nr:hypothetical protein CAEBREN_10332 [Caenorhabditis brenneri]